MIPLLDTLPKGFDPAVLTNIKDKDYRSANGLSQSAIKDFIKSPAHYLVATQQVSEPTPAMQMGTAFHAVMLQDKPSEHYAVKIKMDGRTKDGRAYNEQFASENAGKAIITTEDEEALFKMRDSILAHPLASKLAKGLTHKEFAVLGSIETNEGYVQLKGLIDGYSETEGYIIDYKTCEDASPLGFIKAIRDRRYDLQSVQYPWLLNNAKMKVTDFYFVCVEKVPPYAVGVYRIDLDNLIDTGKKWAWAIGDFCECQNTGKFKAYSDDCLTLSLNR